MEKNGEEFQDFVEDSLEKDEKIEDFVDDFMEKDEKIWGYVEDSMEKEEKIWGYVEDSMEKEEKLRNDQGAVKEEAIVQSTEKNNEDDEVSSLPNFNVRSKEEEEIFQDMLKILIPLYFKRR